MLQGFENKEWQDLELYFGKITLAAAKTTDRRGGWVEF